MYSGNVLYKLIMIGALSFMLSAILVRWLIPFLKKKQMGQNIREEGPEAHLAKAGTPSMGGVGIIIAVVVSAVVGLIGYKTGSWQVVTEQYSVHMFMILAGFVSFGLLGFMDDYLKVIKKENEGLKVIPKFVMQFVIAFVLAVWVYCCSPGGSEIFIPIYGQNVDFGFFFIPFVMFTILAMVNAVNFTDGLDGLAGSVTVIVAIALMIIAGHMENVMSSVFAMALIGGCLGFLLYNHHPARIFMGDTGSMALGGGVTMAAVVMKAELFLPIIGIIYLLEVLSVCIQVSYFKATGGKRIFRMTPLHHHFELGGMSENKVVALFSGITAIACFVAVLLIKC